MPVLERRTHEKLHDELSNRFSELLRAFSRRCLDDSLESIKREKLLGPDEIETIESAIGLRISVKDLENILEEIKKSLNN